MLYETTSLAKAFSVIYVEEEAMNYEYTKQILAKYPNSDVVMIRHYKDVFNRSHQDYSVQNLSKKLVLAVNHGQLIYEGSPVCQNFGAKKFHYLTTIMNCAFNCEYCFLKGMYPSANIVVFVNREDYLEEASKLGDSYLSVSFDTDLLALDKLLNTTSIWVEFARNHPEVDVEIRTKTAPMSFVDVPNLIYAFTLSPDEITRNYESKTAFLDSRIRSVNSAISSGATVRLCFDPIIYTRDFDDIYSRFMDKVLAEIDLTKVRDVSVGTFRVSKEYLKTMRKAEPNSAVVNFPFENTNGYCSYPSEINKKMVDYVKSRLNEVISDERIFCQY